MKRPPTDFELLRAIYERHHAAYVAQRAATTTGVFIAIDIPAVAADLKTEDDTVFGRLYHHLDPLYGEDRREGESRKAFFSAKLGDKANCVNFPLMEAVLAGLWQDRNRQLLAVSLSVVSVGIALAALIVSLTA